MKPAATPNVILHLGLGSFHRAHQAVYVNELIKAGDRNWSIAGGNLRPDLVETIDALARAGGAYTLETISPAGEHRYERVESIKEVVPFEADATRLKELAADKAVKIISFTVTEAGYYLDAKNRLDTATFADLRADVDGVKAGQMGSTIYGALATLLRARMQSGAGPVTLMNCDNLRHNGERSRSGLLQFLGLVGDGELKAWVEKNTTSPNAMVDRITPRPAPSVRTRVKEATGVDDPAALMGESFIQWVIEDDFIAGRPSWETVGVEMVESVQPYEEAKIRLLNATHSCIAWAGTLVGMTFIHEGTRDPQIRQFAYDYVTNDAIPVLQPNPLDLPQYRDVVLDRFSNDAIADTNQRVAMDGFSKIPGFVAPTLRECLERGRPIDSTAMLPALFLAFLQQRARGEVPYEYQDQAMDPKVADAICAADDPVAAFCADVPMFGSLAGDPRLVDAVRRAHERVAAFVQGRRA